jgi:hypothetical protein
MARKMAAPDTSGCRFWPSRENAGFWYWSNPLLARENRRISKELIPGEAPGEHTGNLEMRADTFPATPAQEARFWQLRRALQARYIRRKPTVLERTALDAAALAITRQEFELLDASASADIRSKNAAASQRAMTALIKVAAERGVPPQHRGFGTIEVRA